LPCLFLFVVSPRPLLWAGVCVRLPAGRSKTCIVTPVLPSPPLTFIPISQTSVGDAEMAVKVKVMCTYNQEVNKPSQDQNKNHGDTTEQNGRDNQAKRTRPGERCTEYTGMQFPLSSCYRHTCNQNTDPDLPEIPRRRDEATQSTQAKSNAPFSNDLLASFVPFSDPNLPPPVHPASRSITTNPRRTGRQSSQPQTVGRELCR
jgi:hypothetical protein